MGKNRMKKKRSETVFYHGGFPGLIPGDSLKPYTHTKLSMRKGYALFDAGKMFVTTSRDLATGYALQFARLAPGLKEYNGPALGSVYELKVSGPKVVDEDFVDVAPLHGGPFSFSVTVPPRITKVLDTLAPDQPRENRILAPFQTWESPDGKIYPMWNDAGYVMPNANDTKKGFTAADLQQRFGLGPFPGLDALAAVGLYHV